MLKGQDHQDCPINNPQRAGGSVQAFRKRFSMSQRRYKYVGVAILLSLVAVASDEIAAKYQNTDSPFLFHGRISICNGTPPYRIWIIGTHRILGVSGGDLEQAKMPQSLQAIVTNFVIDVYADFGVTPLTKYEQGAMQIVQVNTVSNLVIYENGRYKETKKSIGSNKAVR